MAKGPTLFLIVCLIFLSRMVVSAAPEQGAVPAGHSLTDFVDVFVGTQGDYGQLYPGATVPFGLVKLSPDTSRKGHAGYDFSDPVCTGFSHTRLGGVGCSGAGGTLKIKPGFGKAKTDRMAKDSESGTPGFYTVSFENGIRVELTVSNRVGFHRYFFPDSSEEVTIQLDPTYGYDKTLESDIKVENNHLLTGFVKADNVCGHKYYTLYYAVLFDQDFIQTEPDGKKLWCQFKPGDSDRVIQLKVGLSPVSVAQAIEECKRDIADWDFDGACRRAGAAWEEKLAKIAIGPVPQELEEFRDLFYTCLYRSYLIPHNVTSSGGTYKMAGDEETVRHTGEVAPDYVNYSGWSTWDDFRKFSLISLMEPEIGLNIARSIVEWFKGGNTPAWGDGYWPTPTVRNEFINAIVLDAWQKGLRGYDAEAAYQGMKTTIHGNDQLEKPYQNYILMKMAESLGKTEDAKAYRELALTYRDYWCAGQVDGEGTPRGFFTADGKPVAQDRVDSFKSGFYEGNLWHYRFFVPHDAQGLINLRGGRELLAEDLDYYFSNWMHTPLNEPPLAYPYLFNYCGRAWRTQYWARAYITDVVTNIYHNHGLFPAPVIRRVYQKQPAGWLPTMDDDTGAMSSHFVFSALGLYPACVGDGCYVIGSPLFPEVALNMGQGRTFTIKANHASLANRYIQSARLNGKPYEKTWIDFKTIQQGGVLEFQMGDRPNRDWGSDPGSAPPSLSEAWEPAQAQARITQNDPATDWFKKARYGVFMHFLPGNPEQLALVDQFDVETLATQLEEMGAGYFVITLGQNSGYMNSPNAAYDEMTGYGPGERCSKRDLPGELYTALNGRGIRLMLYLPCQVPNQDRHAQEAFGLSVGPGDRPINTAFASEWAKVIQEWSDRYGDKVAGWWFDGGYQHIGFNEAIAQIYADAVRHGNPHALITFNPGVKVIRWTQAENYTAGELNEPFGILPALRWLDGSQWHALTFLGSSWSRRDTRFPTQSWADWVQNVVSRSGVVTLDMGPNWDHQAGPIGSLAEAQVQQVKAIRDKLK